MKIGLLGFGVVGRGVYEITANRDDMQVVKVLCLEDVTLPDAEVTRDFNAILNDDSIDTVVEAMGGLHPAYEFVRSAMEAGKNIVTSNKALVATFYDELIPLAEEKGLKFRCTAAVGGGIGWLSELERVRRVVFVSTAYVGQVLGRSSIAIAFGDNISTFVTFITTDIMTLVFAVLIIILFRKTEGLLEDQKAYLLRLDKERKETQDEPVQEEEF